MVRYVPRNLFDNALDELFRDPFFRRNENAVMKTDIKEKDGNYLLEIELPGYKKEDVSIELEKGTLSIGASRNQTTEEKDDNGNLIRQERISGNCSRSYFVGEDITEEDIKAKYEDGILSVYVPKKEPKQVETRKTISIE